MIDRRRIGAYRERSEFALLMGVFSGRAGWELFHVTSDTASSFISDTVLDLCKAGAGSSTRFNNLFAS